MKRCLSFWRRLARIDTVVKGYIDKGWINGVVTLVIHDHHVVQYKGYGWADAESVVLLGRLFRDGLLGRSQIEAGLPGDDAAVAE